MFCHMHILSIFSSLRIFLIASILPKASVKNSITQINSNKIRIKLLTRFGMLKRTLQCSCQTQRNLQIQTFKEAIAVLISNAISDHEIRFEIKHTIKHNFKLKLGKS